MGQKLYFLANDKAGNADLWLTDGTTTEAVGGISDLGVAGSATGGLGPSSLTVFGQQMIFAGADALNTGTSNGLWLTDGTAGGTTEVGGVSPGAGNPSPFTFGNPTGLSPNGFVTFGSKAIFFGTDSANFTGLWVTDGTVGGTEELGGLENGQIVGKGASLSPENLAAFNNSVLFDAFDSSGFDGLWITDGTTGGTVEIGGSKNQGVFDSGLTSFVANDFITLGNIELFNAPNKEGDDALWITDGTQGGTVEIGGVNNAGVAGADNTNLGDGLAQSVRFGDRIFFSGSDNDSANGLWTTDGTANGTIEVGGLEDAGLKAFGQHPSSLGLTPTDLTVNGQQVLFDGQDALGFQELWASDGTAVGTYEIGGEGVGGAVAGEASNGLNPSSITSLGNGDAVFIGDDDSNGQPSGKPTLWVTNGTFAGTQEIGGLDNQGVSNINSGGFTITNLIGGDGLAYFIGEDGAGNQVLWETDGTLGGTKVVGATDGNAPAAGLSPSNMALGPIPTSATSFTGGGQTINLESVPGEEVNLSSTSDVYDTVNGSNGSINLTSAQASVIGGGVLIDLVGGTGNAVALYNTKSNKDSVYGNKGAVTLSAAQADVFGVDESITFATGTSGDVVDLDNTYNTTGLSDTVVGSNGTIHLTNTNISLSGSNNTITAGAGDTITVTSGTGNTITGTGFTVDLKAGTELAVGGNGAAGTLDVVDGSNATVAVQANSHIGLVGSSDIVSMGASSNLSVSGSNDAVTATTGDGIRLNSGTGDAISGKTYVVVAANGLGFTVSGTGETVFAGSNDTITFGASSTMNLEGSSDIVNAASGDVIALKTGTSDTVTGKDVVVYSSTGTGVTVGGNGATGAVDVVVGSNATVGVQASSHATLFGSTDAVTIGSSSNVAIDGSTNTVAAAAGDQITLVSGTGDTFSGKGFVVQGLGNVVFTIKGTGDLVYAGLNDAITDSGASTLIRILGNVGSLKISSFGSDASGVIDLLNGVGGYGTAAAAFAALASDGSGGSKLSLGADGTIDIAGDPPASLKVSNFKIG